MTQEQKGLRLAAAITIGTGVALALAAHPVTNLPVRLLADLLIWPLDGAETGDRPETRLTLAIAGGVMAGWGLMIWHLAGEPLRQMPEVTRALIGRSVLLWFVVDGAASLVAGAGLNILGNLVFLALFLLPMRPALRPGPV